MASAGANRTASSTVRKVRGMPFSPARVSARSGILIHDADDRKSSLRIGRKVSITNDASCTNDDDRPGPFRTRHDDGPRVRQRFHIAKHFIISDK